MLMLTSISHLANFSPLMQVKQKKLIVIIFGILMLQSCYTLVDPPQTLPQTVTTIISEPAMASSIGGAGVYGWDPYWEPALPFTNYHRGYGASYYSPYNYYDYHHPYYAPVYISGEVRTPAPAREFGRDDPQGGGRARDRIGSGTASSSKGGYENPEPSGGVSSAGSGIISTVNPTPVAIPPTKLVLPVKEIKRVPIIRTISPVQVKPDPVPEARKSVRDRSPAPAQKPTIQSNNTTKSDNSAQNTDSSESSPAPKKRNRTRK